MPIVRFTVRYRNASAAFSSACDAMEHAARMSLRHGERVEVWHKVGLVGQYEGGVMTMGFASRWVQTWTGLLPSDKLPPVLRPMCDPAAVDGT